jgi:glycosyltransferase involved in cell wall biosynthesis
MVSILMITYNHEMFIAQAIESAISQKTTFDFELVIGDDISKDSTFEICKKYQQNYPNIVKLLHYEKNVGVTDNLINVYNVCNGKYVAILEGDDYWTDEFKLQKQVDYLEANTQCSLVYTLSKDYYTEKNLFVNTTEKEPNEVDFIYLLHQGWYIRTATIMLRKIIDLEPWRDVKYSFDYLIHYLCALKGSLHKINDFTSVYRRHHGGITNSSIELRLSRMLWYNDLLKRINKFSSFKYENDINKAIKRNNSDVFLVALRYFKINFFYTIVYSDILYIINNIFKRLIKK